jgi:hypothetical protein
MSTSAAVIRYPSFFLNASEHYVGAWALQVGSRTLAEGEISCLRCSMPWRVSVGPMYVLSHVLHVLSLELADF